MTREKLLVPCWKRLPHFVISKSAKSRNVYQTNTKQFWWHLPQQNRETLKYIRRYFQLQPQPLKILYYTQQKKSLSRDISTLGMNV